MAEHAALQEIQLDGLLAPTHHFGALSFGNKASMLSAGRNSRPRAAARQALAKMAAVMRRGLTQCVLPPLLRPDLDFLQRCGFRGSPADIIQACAADDAHLLSLAQSCAFTWTANCATVIPSTDSSDGHCHVIPANLFTTPHRALEGEPRTRMLRHIFGDCDFMQIHDPLPMTATMADEGAANHHRCYDPDTGDFCHLFVHSRAHNIPVNLLPKKYPARQSKEAQIAISRVAQLRTGHSFFITQHPEAIDGGAFHNDVVLAGCNRHLLLHEQALVDQQACVHALEAQMPQLQVAVIGKRDLRLDEAVRSYLFNAQLLQTAAGMHLLLPLQAQEQRPKRVVDRLLSDGFLHSAEYLDLSESMHGGGGPACLRLRLPLRPQEAQQLPQGIVLTEDKLMALEQWVDSHFREELSTADLADPQLYQETCQALDSLTQLLDLGTFYAFQT